tara:strand:- start:297 stop:884 length:588 start_codon:yes stop_codon:yes gene_type:complete
MAKGKNDLILRDRLQFTLDANGDLDVVYGRIDLSDYVSVVNNEGLAIKEVRFQVRNPNAAQTGSFNGYLNPDADAVTFSSLKMFASTTAYESAVDVGLASPNVFALVEHTCNQTLIQEGTANVGGGLFINRYEYGTPDLHPEGYTVVSDVLIGVAALDATKYAGVTLEVDIMLIAEPIKVSKDELKDMLAQATDL